MKTRMYYLRMVVLLLIVVVFHGHSLPVEKGENKRVEQVNRSREKMTAFFSAYLAGEANNYQDKISFGLAEVQKVRNLVWESWKEANRHFSEQKLPELTELNGEHSGQWQLPESLEPHAVMPYYWGYKGKGTPAEGYPLYLYLHGSGEKSREWATGLTICKGFDDAPSVYFIPQIPNMGDYYRWWQKSKQFAWEKMLRLAFVSGKINPDRVYFFGISEGGYGSQRLASFYADYLAAAGPMAGGEPLKNAPVENCRNIAFSLRTGANDYGFYRDKLTRYTREEFEKWQKLYPENFLHWIELIPGMWHGIDYRPTTPWLKQHVRDPFPKFVSWENFEMDGQYRKGFYNLFVKERSNEDEYSRTYYELAIKGNELTLKVELVSYETVETDPNWGIALKSEKVYRPADKGKVVVFLHEELVDLTQKVTLTVNGKKAFQGKVEPQLKHMVNSCALFFDPQRLYPAAIEIDIADL